MTEATSLAGNELRYRQHFLRQDARAFSVFAVILIAAFLILSMADYALWKNEWVFHALLALRISFVILAVTAIIRSLRTTKYVVFDRWALTLGIYVALSNTLVILSRPADYLHSMIAEVLCVIVLYATMPDARWYRWLPSMLLSGGSLICFLVVKEHQGFVAGVTVVLSYLVANMLGARISNAYFGYRRESFFSAEKIEALFQETRDSERMYQLLVQNSHGIIYTIGSDGLFNFVSASWKKMLGHDPSEVTGRDFRDFVHPNDIQACEAFLHTTVDTGEIQHGAVYRVLHRDGSYRWHQSNIVPCFNEDRKIVSFVGNAVDVTERILRETELEQARLAADEANQVKSEFLAVVSHEIRTPLNAMVGFSALARNTSSPVVLREYLEIIDGSARTLIALINSILDMSKIEANRIVLEAIPVGLGELLRTLVSDYRRSNAGRPIDFIFRFGDDVPEWVISDPLRLRQILTNLLCNAFKFTTQGSIVLNVLCINTPLNDGTVTLRFGVQDTGIGIPDDQQSRLFEPFRQLDPSISRKFGGTGLGLAIVRRLVLLMGGDITVTSKEGYGSTFIVELPLQPSLAPPVQDEPVMPKAKSALSVLVVEDNNFNRKLMHDILTTWGHRVTLAVDGNDALGHVAREVFDLILMDLRMPGLDGIEASRRIRSAEKKTGRSRIPIIAVTADTGVNTQQACGMAGVDAVLDKPVTPDKLATLLAGLAIGPHTAPDAQASPDSAPLLSEQSLRDMGRDEARYRIFAALLRTDIEEETQRVASSLHAENRPMLKQIAHTLKGLCAHLRDPLPRDLAQRLQSEADSASLPALREMVNNLREAINRTVV